MRCKKKIKVRNGNLTNKQEKREEKLMESIYRTGNAVVDQISGMEITGNVIPSAWYRTIRKETGKPYLNAIIILSDIVYWYRAIEVRDEESGEILGYRKKFKADILQRSYQQIAEQFGISKRDASNAMVALEKLGVVKRVFRKLKVDRFIIPNVMFLALDVEVLRRLTFPEDGGPGEGDGKEREEGMGEDLEVMEETDGEVWSEEGVNDGAEMGEAAESEKAGNSGKEDEWNMEGEGHAKIGDTSESREKELQKGEKGFGSKINGILGHLDACFGQSGYPACQESVSPERVDASKSGSRLLGNRREDTTYVGETNTEITYKDYNRDSLILSSYQGIREEFKRQIEYDILKHDLGDTDELDELVEIASEVLTSAARTIRVNREERKAAEVKERYKSLTMFHVQYVLRCMSETAVKIRNIRAVMITALYNASSTISTYYGNLYRYHAVGAA